MIFTLMIFLSIIKVKADGFERNVNFTLVEKFYSTVTKSYVNGITVFDYTNNIKDIDISNDQLRSLLNQRAGLNSNPLTIYETLNIDVTPLPETSFASLIGENTLYRGNGGGKWVNNLENQIIAEQTTAEVKNMNSYFWPYGFKVQYRTNTEDSFTTTIPNGVNLSNKTIEEQLAILLGIDLINNPEGVIDAYDTLYNFKVLPTGYIYLNRYDFYDMQKGVTPELKTGNEYYTSSLDLLGSEYVAIRYHDGGTQGANDVPTFEEVNNQIKKLDIVLLIVAPLFIISVGTIYYLKNNKKMQLKTRK